MSIRLPLTTVLDYNDAGQTGATSVLGGVANSVIAGAVSATFQTSDDGGTTWYDVARTSVVSNTGASILGGSHINAEWLSIPVIGAGMRTAVTVNGASVMTAGIGSAAASTLAQRQVSGLPILGVNNRIFLIYTAAVSGTDIARVQVKVNSQSATA